MLMTSKMSKGLYMFFSLFLIFFLGIVGGILVSKIKIPKIIYYLILGILLGPSVFNLLDEGLLNISSYLRQIALVIILTRSGLNLDLKSLKNMGRSAALLSFLPASFEILGIVIFAPLILNINIFEALLLGSVLAAVSPAIVVPRMIKIKEEGYGKTKGIGDMILASSSIDDIYVIVLFYSFKGLVATNNFNALSLFNIPLSIILGILIGLLIGLTFYFILKRINLLSTLLTLILLGVSFGLLYLETSLKDIVSISSLVAIIVLALCVARNENKKEELKKTYSSLWNAFELLLFVLIGALTDLKYALSIQGLKILGLIIISLLFRSLGVLISVSKTKLNIKEKIFVIFAFIPKATVQASIGAIAFNEGLSVGLIILTGAVISILFTAPLGALLIDSTYKKLLSKDDPLIEDIPLINNEI